MSTRKCKTLITVLAQILTFVKLHRSSKRPAEKTCPCKCRRCRRALTSPASRAAGIGPVCARLEKLEAMAKQQAVAGPGQMAFDFNGTDAPPKVKLSGKALRVIMGLEKP